MDEGTVIGVGSGEMLGAFETLPEEPSADVSSPAFEALPQIDDEAALTPIDPVVAELIAYKGGTEGDWTLESKGDGFVFDGENILNAQTGEPHPFDPLTLAEMRAQWNDGANPLLRLPDAQESFADGSEILHVTHLILGPDNNVTYEIHSTVLRGPDQEEAALVELEEDRTTETIDRREIFGDDTTESAPALEAAPEEAVAAEAITTDDETREDTVVPIYTSTPTSPIEATLNDLLSEPLEPLEPLSEVSAALPEMPVPESAAIMQAEVLVSHPNEAIVESMSEPPVAEAIEPASQEEIAVVAEMVEEREPEGMTLSFVEALTQTLEIAAHDEPIQFVAEKEPLPETPETDAQIKVMERDEAAPIAPTLERAYASFEDLPVYVFESTPNVPQAEHTETNVAREGAATETAIEADPKTVAEAPVERAIAEREPTREVVQERVSETREVAQKDPVVLEALLRSEAPRVEQAASQIREAKVVERVERMMPKEKIVAERPRSTVKSGRGESLMRPERFSRLAERTRNERMKPLREIALHERVEEADQAANSNEAVTTLEVVPIETVDRPRGASVENIVPFDRFRTSRGANYTPDDDPTTRVRRSSLNGITMSRAA